jgi:HAD superfamily hydrolase (TIGR01484 family)
MPPFHPDDSVPPRVLVTDLDGTLIPIEGNLSNPNSLKRIGDAVEDGRFDLVFATGRHYASVLQAIEAVPLPHPSWIACDVGTSIYKREGGSFKLYPPYQDHLDGIAGGHDHAEISEAARSLKGLEPQPEAHQGRFKVSFFCPPAVIEEITRELSALCEQAGYPYHCLGSLDPFTGRGLIDLLPLGVNKAYAILWLSTHADFHSDEVVFAGDSGNDLAALVSGFRAILVGNASTGLKEQVRDAMKGKGVGHRLYLAGKPATCGVVEGLRHFGLLEDRTHQPPADSRM